MTSLENDPTLRVIAWPKTTGPLKCGPGLRDCIELNTVLGSPPAVAEAPTSVERRMDFTAAKKAAQRGARIRRPHWDNCLRMNPDGALEFVTAVHMYGKIYERNYHAEKHELNATDWIAA